ncbi:sporulation protein YqfD [Clostridium culturomicium]|uniref:sporulation protein YqfD n=2 Tax=Clostridium culturomicium TaxID=1499683 RepID=UPI00058F743E
MIIMKRFDDVKASYVTVRIEAVEIEKILNFLWNKNVDVRDIKNNNKFSVDLKIELKDYKVLREGVKKARGKLVVLDRKGMKFFFMHLNSRKFLVAGIAAFFFVLYYLSTFIWKVDIITERYLAPVEVRNMLKEYGIDVTKKKTSINVVEVEKALVRDFDEIMWIKVRIEGSKLSVEIKERQEPPKIKEKPDYTGNIVARKNGIVNRINTISGTPVVKPGQVVNAGDILIQGQEGKETMEFQVMAEGKVPSTVFYEEILEVPKTYVEKERTGNKKVRYGINVNNKIIYLGKSLNNFVNYDKIETKWGIFIREEYFETEEVEKTVETDGIVKDLQNKIYLNLDRAAKVLSVAPEIEDIGEKNRIRVLVTVEEDIAKSEIAPPQTEEQSEEDSANP